MLPSTSRTSHHLLTLHHLSHNSNLTRIAPSVNTRLSPATSRTLALAHSPNHSHNRSISPLQMHQIQYDNHRIINRLLSIQNGRELRKNGGYARYNEFQRQFRKKKINHSLSEVERENQRIYRKLSAAKPRIGSKQQWQKNGKQMKKYMQIGRKMQNERQSKSKNTSRKREEQMRMLQAKIREGMQRQERYDIEQEVGGVVLPAVPDRRRRQ